MSAVEEVGAEVEVRRYDCLGHPVEEFQVSQWNRLHIGGDLTAHLRRPSGIQDVARLIGGQASGVGAVSTGYDFDLILPAIDSPNQLECGKGCASTLPSSYKKADCGFAGLQSQFPVFSDSEWPARRSASAMGLVNS